MTNEPFGITTISGQNSHSLKLSFGFSACSNSGVRGCTPLSGMICLGSGAGGCGCACSGGFARTCLVLADTLLANEMARVAASAASSLDVTDIRDPCAKPLRLGRVRNPSRSYHYGSGSEHSYRVIRFQASSPAIL